MNGFDWCPVEILIQIYATIDRAVKETGSEPPDLLICCGDFQAFRNRSDLNTFAAPPKYRQMGDFWKYYNGEKVHTREFFSDVCFELTPDRFTWLWVHTD